MQRLSSPSGSYGIPYKVLAKSRIYQDEVDDPDETSTDDDRNSSALQWLITNRMKLVLMKDLGYTESEIDQMEPQVGVRAIFNYHHLNFSIYVQIAAVVIERKLRRPLKGMPESWRKHNPNTFLIVARTIRKNLVCRTLGVVRFARSNWKYVIPALIISSSIVSQKRLIMSVIYSMWPRPPCDSDIAVPEARDQFPVKNIGFHGGSLFSRWSKTPMMRSNSYSQSPSVGPARVDIVALSKLQSR